MSIIFRIDTWQEIFHSLKNNKLRTFLTMVGVGWGMFLFVVLLGASKGVENGFERAFSGFATNSIFLWAQTTNIPFEGFPKGRTVELDLDDITYLNQNVEGIDIIAPRNSRGGRFGDPIPVARNENMEDYVLYGDYPVGDQISKKRLVSGRYINQSDIGADKYVAVIGKEVYEALFKAQEKENPIGKSININGSYFTVIGVFKTVTNGPRMEGDDSIFIPFSTFNNMFNQGNKADMFAIVGLPHINMDIFEEEIKAALRKRHRIHPADENAYASFNLVTEFKKVDGFITGLQLLTIVVGMLTILAGVIAISNILLITVKERTKEIGIRRAVGATPSDIRNQILLESVVITFASGFIGFILGNLLLMVLDMATADNEGIPFSNPAINYGDVAGALFIMLVLGIFIGLIPAQRAVRIHPIEAIQSY